jgi:hypothetical protein
MVKGIHYHSLFYWDTARRIRLARSVEETAFIGIARHGTSVISKALQLGSYSGYDI